MSSKHAKAVPEAEAPITGVAAGSLGTAANLEDTKVMRTAELRAAAPPLPGPAGNAPRAPIPGGRIEAEPVEAEPVAAEPVAAVPSELEPVPAAPVAAARPRANPRAAPSTAAVAGGGPIWRNRSAPALAGVAALLVLVLIAGSGFVSQLDLGIGAGREPAATANALGEVAPSPTAQPNQGKGDQGKCHGRGKKCQVNGD